MKITVSGAAGFIGSCLVSALNKEGENNLIMVDDFSRVDKMKNLQGKSYTELVPREEFFEWFHNEKPNIDCVLHMGARTDTAEFDVKVFDKLNLNYSKEMWKLCTEQQIPLLYASSAATYGLGEFGYVDDHSIIPDLKPLNPYGESKNEFDKWVLKQDEKPPFWAGFKFFNVYGPNEYHKGRMASVIFHAFHQIGKTDAMKLFRSHHPDFKDGEQLRDFVYVKDLAKVLLFMMRNQPESGIYNLGTGTARTFLDLTKAVFAALGKEADISFIDTPKDIRDKYQYFTEANMNKLLKAGYNQGFASLEEGVQDYVANYLMKSEYF